MIVVHVTHEAVEKIGGIGTVIDGLTTADAYAETVSRTILVGPLFTTDNPVNRRLGPDGAIRYSSLDEIEPPEYRHLFRPIERTYDVGIIYGTRRIHEPYSGRIVEVEVLLVDVFHANPARLNLFKGELYTKFGVPSDRFENVWEYEQYVRIAEPAVEALKALGADGRSEPVVLLSHEYMGMPTALKAVLDGGGEKNIKTVFYAHEVASVRPIVENYDGHDTMFYNVMCAASAEGKRLSEVFPEVENNFKHPLVRAAQYCDHVFAVGDYVASELKFVDPKFERVGIDRVYNGIPAEKVSIEQKHASRKRLGDYAEALLGWRPDWIFTHVARPVLSKGIWRDVRVLHEMESMLADRGERVAYFMLGTLGGQRRDQDVRAMEAAYGWPVAHEMGYPDLCGGEDTVWETFDCFNADHRQSRAILVNQWGWEPGRCGQRMPEGMTIADLRRGADLEFGLSVYEPFGISQFETLCFGALCVVSNVCGCMGFARATMGEERAENILEGDFLQIGDVSLEAALQCGVSQRDAVEHAEGLRLAERIVELLPRDEATLRRRLETGYELARAMSWEKVVSDYFLPALSHATQ